MIFNGVCMYLYKQLLARGREKQRECVSVYVLDSRKRNTLTMYIGRTVSVLLFHFSIIAMPCSFINRNWLISFVPKSPIQCLLHNFGILRKWPAIDVTKVDTDIVTGRRIHIRSCILNCSRVLRRYLIHVDSFLFPERTRATQNELEVYKTKFSHIQN